MLVVGGYKEGGRNAPFLPMRTLSSPKGQVFLGSACFLSRPSNHDKCCWGKRVRETLKHLLRVPHQHRRSTGGNFGWGVARRRMKQRNAWCFDSGMKGALIAQSESKQVLPSQPSDASFPNRRQHFAESSSWRWSRVFALHQSRCPPNHC